jgi:hypothetical protein
VTTRHSSLIGWINDCFHLQQRITDVLSGSGGSVLEGVVTAGTAVFGAITDVLIVIVLTVYFLVGMARIRTTLYRLIPDTCRPGAILPTHWSVAALVVSISQVVNSRCSVKPISFDHATRSVAARMISGQAAFASARWQGRLRGPVASASWMRSSTPGVLAMPQFEASELPCHHTGSGVGGERGDVVPVARSLDRVSAAAARGTRPRV